MTRRSRAYLAAAGLTLLSGCGVNEQGVIVKIESNLQITAEVDSLQIDVTSAADGHILASQTKPLRTGEKFPLTVALIPTSSTPTAIIVDVTAQLSGQAVAQAQGVLDWAPGHVVEATLQLY